MLDNLPLILFILGGVLFVVGDVLWLWRNTFNRPMNLKLSGGLIGAGVLLLAAGLIALVVREA